MRNTHLPPQPQLCRPTIHDNIRPSLPPLFLCALRLFPGEMIIRPSSLGAMAMTRQINSDGEKLIKQWEAFIPFAYDDFDPPLRRRVIKPGDKINGTLTIGYRP